MKIEKKEIIENYNISKESDGDIFLKWISILVGLTLSIFVFFLLLGNIIVNFVSLDAEKKLFLDYKDDFTIDQEKTDKLKNILGNDFEYEIFVIKNSEVNAYTLPGGTIIVSDSLLSEIKYENSLLFILGHEIGHIKNRDVLKSVVSEFPLKVIFVLIGISGDIDLSSLANGTEGIYSKSIESNADIYGIEFLNNLKGNVSCSLYFFEKNNLISDNISTFLSDHPMTNTRLLKLKDIIKLDGYKNDLDCKLLNF
ncbi:MAG: M48 family metallopeptidase [Candidatus Gracilibacteria bacterium]|nr:M48 family metallopeptidase [Candidatus Gracilibacteria bacterium]